MQPSHSDAVVFYTGQMDQSLTVAGPRARRKTRAVLLKEVPLAEGRLGELPPEIAAIVRQAAARIDAWTPKGVHFGWETAFRNKGKFPASMSKAEARALVQRVLLEAVNRHRSGLFHADSHTELEVLWTPQAAFDRRVDRHRPS